MFCRTAALLVALLLSGTAYAQETEAPAYQKLEQQVINIFTNSCARAGCHAGSAAQQGMNLTKEKFFGHTVNAPSRERPSLDLVEPGRPDSSYLFMKVSGHKDIVGVQMPLTGKLNEDEVSSIKQWIEQLPQSKKLASSREREVVKYALPFNGWTTINTPTNRMVDEGLWLFQVSHRFSPKITSGSDQLYGLDGGANILLSMGYALSDETLVNLGRSRINGTVTGQIKHRFLRQTLSETMPVSLAGHLTVNWASTAPPEDRYQSRFFTYTGQVSVTRELWDGLGVTVVPGVTFNPNMETDGEDPMITLGLGGRYRFWRNMAVIGEWNPILSGYTSNRILGNFNRFDSWGTGVEIAVGGHVFQIFLTNSFGITPNQYLQGGDLDIRNESLRLGFSIYRTLNL